MRSRIKKVFAYITWQDRLLIFRHVWQPEAGLQVPAGTLEPGETPAEGVLREALEETGLVDLALVCFVGEQVRDMADFGRAEIHHFHLRCTIAPPETWCHAEATPLHHEGDAPLIFEFFWAPLPNGVPPLIADHDWFVSAITAK
jgi:8-oxo-dGTP diphosphatase